MQCLKRFFDPIVHQAEKIREDQTCEYQYLNSIGQLQSPREPLGKSFHTEWRLSGTAASSQSQATVILRLDRRMAGGGAK
jgi:hypothetical protein